ncbi:hypothetical protein RB599_007955 [Gaeumannomyces hyphopodioides]
MPRISASPMAFAEDDSSSADGEAFTVLNDDDGILVIGIDFGTTFSGVAWATSDEFESDQNSANIITTWPGNGREEGKVPTEIAYGGGGEVSWGFEVPADADPVRWFKLLLLRPGDLTDELLHSEILTMGRMFLAKTGKTAVEVIADYLRLLWNHTLDTITKNLGEIVVKSMAFRVVITVPAIWKPYARQSMQEAARLAGILEERSAGLTTMSFVPEPEAAALATLTEPGRKPNKDDIFIICDAGGGTVDLISYRIDKVGPIAVSEYVEGTGALCGGVFIDAAFKNICRERLESRWDALSKRGVRQILNVEWEYGIKPQFKASDSHKDFVVCIPAEAFAASQPTVTTDISRQPIIVNGCMHIPGTMIQSTFDKSFAGTDKLVDGQIDAVMDKGGEVTGLILVGGLGSSPYLYEHLKATHSKRGVAVLQATGIKPRTAICRGAVFRGFVGDKSQTVGIPPVLITSTISRANVGIRVAETFDPSKHLPADRYFDERELKYMAHNQMSWYLKRGDTVSSREPVRRNFYRIFSNPADMENLSEYLYECNDLIAPTRKRSDMEMLCVFDYKIDRPFDQLPDWTNAQNESFKRFCFELELIPSGSSVELSLYYQGRKQGSKSFTVRFL